MFWKKKGATEELPKPKGEKLPGPRPIEETVGRHLVVNLKQEPDRVWGLRSVTRRRTDGKHRFDFRVFDEAQAAKKKVKVQDWTTFDQHPELILFQGWVDKVSMEVYFDKKQAL